MAARCCSSTSSKATARPRWSSAPARGGHEWRGCCASIAARGMVAMVAPFRLLDAGRRCFCGADRAVAAVVDLAGRHLHRVLARLVSADRRLSRLVPFAEAADLRDAGGAV